MTTYTLYGSEMSYFTGKARAYLRWKGVDFTEIPPTPDVMQNVIIKHVGWPVIPVMRMPDGEIVQDTADIIDAIEARHPAPPVMPAGPVQRYIALLLQVFADEWLTIPAMHYRWNHNEDWIYGQFGKSAAPNGTPEEQYEAGKAVGQRFKGFVPILGVSEATIPGIEAAYEAFLAEFSAHLEQLPFTLGHRPCLADFALIGPLYAHQYHDPWSGALMKRIAPRVADWVERTIAGDGGDGDLVPADAIPETLHPILKRQIDEQLPVLTATNAMLGLWAADAEPQENLPRGFDMVPFTTGGCSGQCMARTFPLYRLQAALDARDALNSEDRARADAMLAGLGGEALANFTLAARLTRRNYRLALA